MPRWNEGTIIDIPARLRFQRETTPIWLVTACTLLGSRAPSLSKPFRYADLGCGAGFTALTVAATNPRAEVWGFDFNPANIETARDLADQAHLTNVRFEEVSFAAIAERELPEFDFMVADAVLSVVSPDNQARVQGLIGRHLRPGGLAYLGYNAETGWADFAPAQVLMRMLFEAGTEASDFAVAGTFPYLDRLRTGGALYFQRNPVLEGRIAEIRRRPAADLAHEFLGQEWHPLTFADVCDAMAEAKCDFLGRATLHENIAAEAVPPAMLPLLDDTASVRIRETMQDVAAATAYRRDIYRRGLNFLAVAEHQGQLAAITVAALDHADPAKPRWPGHAPPDPALYRPLTEALRRGPLTVAGAHALRDLRDDPIEAAADAVAMLIAAGHAHPIMPPLLGREAAAAVGRLNDVIIDAITRGEELGYLVSPVLGTAFESNAWEILTVGALLYGRRPDDLAGLTDGVLLAMRRGGRSVVRDGAVVEDAREAKTILGEVIVGILEHRVPVFRALGVLPG
jgi:SAM-dependent methyltransferase